MKYISPVAAFLQTAFCKLASSLLYEGTDAENVPVAPIPESVADLAAIGVAVEADRLECDE